MSTGKNPGPAVTRTAVTRTAVSRTAGSRLAALGRAELTLLLRNRVALFTVLFMPLLMVFAMQSAVSGMDLEGSGLTASGVLMNGLLGMVLLFVVYSNLVSTYVARREELVLKRLRTGEASDLEVLVGTALPGIAVALVQSALMLAGGVAVLDLPVPANVPVLLAGLLMGVAMMTAMAAASTVFTRTAESAQLSTLPLILVSFLGSGLFVPLGMLPDTVADVLGLLPFTPVMEIVGAGLAGAPAADLLRPSLVGLVWTGLAVLAVRRWFRWEPRH
ncbi:ABC transporter permease [Streptomyces sp. NPDC059506]|uniref:ABC transporter permease n=1 Tax=Streptomyces sp. NPDC059506 TaxID=3347751 RepID=UPI00368D76DB